LRAQQMTNPADAQVATLRINVGGDDIAGLQLMAAKPSIARGRVVVDPAAAASLPPRLMLSLTSVQMMMMIGVQPAAVADDVNFELKATPGVFRVSLGPASPGWTIRSVRLNGADVTDSGVEIKANEDLAGLEVELTNKLTTITGLVTNARGDLMKDYSAV